MYSLPGIGIHRFLSAGVVVRNPRIWIYLVVGLMAAGLIGYSQWHDSDAQRLQR